MVVRHRDVDPGTVAMELAGLLVGVLTFALMLPLVPVGLLTHHFRKRAAAPTRA